MQKPPLIFCAFLILSSAIGVSQESVRIETPALLGPRSLPEQARTAVIRDYLQSWQSLRAAFDQNRPDLLSPAFVGTAQDKLAGTIQQQVALGISTRYQDRAHDLQIVFYSPEGLSIEIIDKVNYDIQIIDNGRIKTVQNVTSTYVIVLTPAEVRWRVRVFQAESE